MNYAFLGIVIAIVLAVLGIAVFTNFSLTNEQYDRLKWLTIRWSYLTTFIGLVAKTFDIPYGVETVTIVAGIGAMLAGLLGISNHAYEETQEIVGRNEREEDEQKMVKGE